MMPVDSTRNAATHETSGSYSRAWAGVIRFAGTPLAAARSASTSSAGISCSPVATTSFPQTSTGTPCCRAKSMTDRLPATDMRALNEPGL